MFYNWVSAKTPGQHTVLPKNPSHVELRNFGRNAICRIPVTQIEDTISRLPYVIENVDPNDTRKYSKQRKQITNIIESPNLVNSRVAFTKLILEDMLVARGAGAFEKVPCADTSHPLYLYPTDATTIQHVVPYDYQHENAARYAQQQPEGTKYFSAQQLAYIQKEYFTHEPYPVSPLMTAYQYVRAMLTAGERADEVAANSTSEFLLYFKGMSETTLNEFRKYMAEEIEGTGKIPIIAGGDAFESKQIKAISKDSLMTEYQEFLRVIVGMAFKMPPRRMGVMTSTDRSTEADLDNYILENVIKPWANVIEDMWNQHVIAQLGYEGILKFKFKYELTDAQTNALNTRICTQYTTGLITRNDGREALGYPMQDTKYAQMTSQEATSAINTENQLIILNESGKAKETGGFNGVGKKPNEGGDMNAKEETSGI